MASDKKPPIIKILEIAYLALFAVSLTIAIGNDILHLSGFSVFKIPTYLRAVGPLLGIPWPLSFNLYHVFLIVLAIISSLNLYGIGHIQKKRWRRIAKFSSFGGLLMAFFIVVFFLSPLILSYPIGAESIKTSLIYCIFGLIFLSVDVLTFVATYMRISSQDASMQELK